VKEKIIFRTWISNYYTGRAESHCALTLQPHNHWYCVRKWTKQNGVSYAKTRKNAEEKFAPASLPDNATPLIAKRLLNLVGNLEMQLLPMEKMS
jgi:hypothetical protein